MTWVKGIADGKSNPPEAPKLPAWCLVVRYPTYASLKPTFYNCYFRAGLVAYLGQRNDVAAKLFADGDKFDNSDRKQLGAETSMARLIKIVQGKMPKLTPDDVLTFIKNDNQKTAVLLADLYLIAYQPELAGKIYERLLAGEKPLPKPQTGVEAYLLWRMGQALKFQRKHDEAVACLTRLYDPKYAKHPWAAEGLFRLGTWTYNSTQDSTSAMKHWEYVSKAFPKHSEAERSLFYIGLTASYEKNHAKAVDAFREYLRRYPDGPSAKRVRERELPRAEEKLKGSAK